MHSHLMAGDAIASAAEHGTICATAADCQADLQVCAKLYPGLLPADPFDPRLYSTVALANAFGSPWLPPDRLRIATRTSLWVFAADWQVDYLAKSHDRIDELTRICLAVADGGAPPDDEPLALFLADIRDELAATPSFAAHRAVWRDQLDRYLAAMAREWRWKTAHRAGEAEALPSFDEYLDNADNFGSTWVNISHWILTCEPGVLDRVDELRAASQQVQRVLRLLNDLASYDRDLRWGDLNALLLGVGRAEVAERVAALVDGCRELFEPLRDGCPQEVAYLERQIGYSTGFYGLTDYWGRS